MKKICLTFDDGLESHYTVAKPLLKKHNLKGTFFITCEKSLWTSNMLMFSKNMAERAFDFKHLKEFEEDGFEIGNHTFSHINLTTLSDEQIVQEISAASKILLAMGVKNINTFCYPGYWTDSRVAKVIENLGFTHARTGYTYQDVGWTQWEIDKKPDQPRPKIKYPQDSESKFLIKPKGILNHVYRFEEFKQDVENMEDDESAVFVFHGLKETRLKEDFKKIVDFLSKNSSIETINFRDLQ